MLFFDYTNEVLQDYQKKLAANQLPLNLSQPKPARLRDECLIVFGARPLKTDEKVLRDFFGPPGQQGYAWVIENWQIGRLKAVINFLNDPTIRTDEKNVELLAWLTNFEPRPFENWKRVSRLTGKKEESGKEETATTNNEDQRREEDGIEDTVAPSTEDRNKEGTENKMLWQSPQPMDKEQAQNKESIPLGLTPVLPMKQPGRSANMKVWGVLLILILGLATGAVIYQGNNSNRSGMLLGGSTSLSNECMYWAGDHYEPVKCSQQIDDTRVEPIDTVKLRRFKKITNPDTITENDIGRLWYTKVSGQMEFYTRDGYHPVKYELRLKPITGYIIEKYIRAGQVLNK